MKGGKVIERSGGVTVIKYPGGSKAIYKPTKDGTSFTFKGSRR